MPSPAFHPAPRRACRRTQSGTSPCRRRTGTAGGRGRGTCTPGRTRAPPPWTRLAAAHEAKQRVEGMRGEGSKVAKEAQPSASGTAASLQAAQCMHARRFKMSAQLTPSRRLRMRSWRSRCRRSSCTAGRVGANEGHLIHVAVINQLNYSKHCPESCSCPQITAGSLWAHLRGVQLLARLRGGGGLDAPPLGQRCSAEIVGRGMTSACTCQRAQIGGNTPRTTRCKHTL